LVAKLRKGFWIVQAGGGRKRERKGERESESERETTGYEPLDTLVVGLTAGAYHSSRVVVVWLALKPFVRRSSVKLIRNSPISDAPNPANR